ncbi:hypothetical protein AB0A60_35645 [Streptomyces sp. NPDC046275]|uniref:hypothetical protein n=1 Tax=Streptomyces sp. NPDC046275 TaxID=3157201 RepID=UPI00340F8002
MPHDPAPPTAREPWDGEEMVLAEANAAGRRAADWIRALPLPADSWVRGALADAVEDAMAHLDPGDRDDIDEYGRAVEGRGGLPEGTENTLDGLIFDMPQASLVLSAAQQIALLAIVHCARHIPRLLANDPGTVIEDGELAALCRLLDSAART